MMLLPKVDNDFSKEPHMVKIIRSEVENLDCGKLLSFIFCIMNSSQVSEIQMMFCEDGTCNDFVLLKSLL